MKTENESQYLRMIPNGPGPFLPNPKHLKGKKGRDQRAADWVVPNSDPLKVSLPSALDPLPLFALAPLQRMSSHSGRGKNVEVTGYFPTCATMAGIEGFERLLCRLCRLFGPPKLRPPFLFKPHSSFVWGRRKKGRKWKERNKKLEKRKEKRELER